MNDNVSKGKHFFENMIRFKRDIHRFVPHVIIGIVMFYVFYLTNAFSLLHLTGGGSSPTQPVSTEACHTWEVSHLLKQEQCRYDSNYPFSRPIQEENILKYKIALIADLDEERSKVTGEKYKWKSYFKSGYLVEYDSGEYKVEWDKELTLTSRLNEKGRGFELSELCAFNGRLYTVDDRTGIVYQIDGQRVIPWVILMDGNGNEEKGFKAEWMTVKDGSLFIGGLGKEWTTKEGEFLNYNPLFVKSIDQFGGVVHHNWTNNYLKVRQAVGIKFPGYMVHEAVIWSSIKKRWYFLPRRMSALKYDDTADERRGTNVLISCDVDFLDFTIVHVGVLNPTHGFSSLKFMPGTGDSIAVALKSKEVSGNIQSYIMVFQVETGRVLMDEFFVANDKYEGVEFI